MKSLKIVLIAITSIVLLTGVASINTEPTSESSNKEVKKVQLDLTALIDKKSVKAPTQG